MGKKTVKSGSVLGYLWILLGLALLLVATAVHFDLHSKIGLDQLGALAGGDKAILRYIGMGVGGVLMIVGFMNKPRKSEKK
ncbi:MAG: hypothetical protein AB7K09_08675 [Planctomycetota bacterium]